MITEVIVKTKPYKLHLNPDFQLKKGWDQEKELLFGFNTRGIEIDFFPNKNIMYGFKGKIQLDNNSVIGPDWIIIISTNGLVPFQEAPSNKFIIDEGIEDKVYKLELAMLRNLYKFKINI